MRSAYLVIAIACSGAKPVGRAPVLADLGWLAGRWHSDALDSHWQMIEGTLWGIALHDGGFEVNWIANDGQTIALTSIEEGNDLSRFELVSADPARIELGGPQGAVRVTRTQRGWRGEFTPPNQPAIAFELAAAANAPAPELEAADRAFEVRTAPNPTIDGADGWMRHFGAESAMWRGRRIEGVAIREAIAKTLAENPLRWTPIASGARGDVGFTLGTYTHGSSRGSYATIWRRPPDGTWRVTFDIGRPTR
jgi:hypothetical protein